MEQAQDASLTRALEIIRDIDFPTLPLYLQLIQREIQQKEPSFSKIAGYISSDIALTAKVLKVVNSPAFATRYVIDDILQALTTLGLDLFYTAVLEEAIQIELKRQNLSAHGFAIIWRHSTKVAVASRFLAEKCSQYEEISLRVDPNQAYLAGLFHDCGIPIMAARFPDYEMVAATAFRNGNTLLSCEDKNYSTDHSVVCYLVAKMWQLQPVVCEAIFCHHDTDLAYYKSSQVRELSLLLRMAESFIEEIENGRGEKHAFTADYISLSEMIPLVEHEFGVAQSIVEELYNELERELLH